MSEKTYRVLVLILLVVLVLVVGASAVLTYQTNKANRDLATQDAARVEQCKLAIQNSGLYKLQTEIEDAMNWKPPIESETAYTNFLQLEAIKVQNTILSGCLP